MTQQFHLGIYQTELKSGVQTKTCKQMFIAALFTIAKGENNQNIYQLMMDKLWYIHKRISFGHKKE